MVLPDLEIMAVIVLGLTAGCSEPETETRELGETIFRQEVIEQPEAETQESGVATSTQELLDRVRSVRGDRDPLIFCCLTALSFCTHQVKPPRCREREYYCEVPWYSPSRQ